jgi:hypothetical protein
MHECDQYGTRTPVIMLLTGQNAFVTAQPLSHEVYIGRPFGAPKLSECSQEFTKMEP